MERSRRRVSRRRATCALPKTQLARSEARDKVRAWTSWNKQINNYWRATVEEARHAIADRDVLIRQRLEQDRDCRECDSWLFTRDAGSL